MYNLFTDEDNLHLSQIHFPEFDYVRRTYIRELANVVDFYHQKVYAVKSDHFLVNVLNHINVPFQYPVDRYVETANARAPYLAKTLNMSSEINTGQLFNGVFYGQGVKEIILFDDEYFNPFYAEKIWERISAVKVLLHPKSDLNLLLPNGRNSSTGDGLAVISVNIALLALQYRCFVMQQQTKVSENRGMLGIAHFIHMYVLPNMLYSQIDITILNRFMNICTGAPMGQALVKHPFMVLDYTHRTDEILKRVKTVITQKPERFDAAIRQIPSIVADDMLRALMMPDLAQTRQVQWALILSRLNIMDFLIITVGQRSLQANRMEIHQLQRLLRRMVNDNTYKSILKGDLLFDTKETIDHILAIDA